MPKNNSNNTVDSNLNSKERKLQEVENLDNEYQEKLANYNNTNNRHAEAQDRDDEEVEARLLPKLEKQHEEVSEARKELTEAMMDFMDKFFGG
jgi:DNA repair exonuclease SbcCD ATPase subunit